MCIRDSCAIALKLTPLLPRVLNILPLTLTCPLIFSPTKAITDKPVSTLGVLIFPVWISNTNSSFTASTAIIISSGLIANEIECSDEACVISKERLFPTDVFRRFGWDENEARDFSNNAGFALEFQRLLFSRVVPNLSRIGLLTDKVRPLYDKLGVLEFESHSTDGDISWAELEKPLDLTG